MREQGILEAPVDEHQITITHEPGRNRRSLRNTFLAGGAAIGVAFLAINGIEDLGSSIWSGISGALPHRQLDGEVFSALERVSLPDRTTLVEAEGISSAKIHIEPDWSFPVVGWFWNNTGAKLSNMDAYAQRQGQVKIDAAQGAVTLKPYRTGSLNTDHQWGIEATVNPTKLSFAKDMDYVLDSTGNAEVKTDDGVLAKMANVVGISTDQAKRVANTTTISDKTFENNCGAELVPDLGAGVSKAVRYFVGSVAALLAQTPNGQSSADLLRSMEQQPVRVIFRDTHPSHGDRGPSITETISPTNVTIPGKQVETKQSIASTFHLSPDSVTFSSGCYFTGQAITDQVRIQAQSASVTSTGVATKG